MPLDELRDCPIWWNGKDVVEAAFCEDFMSSHQITYDGNAFFTPEGRMTDELPLRRAIYNELKDYAVKNTHHMDMKRKEFSGTTTVCSEAGNRPYLLLPVIPSKKN